MKKLIAGVVLFFVAGLAFVACGSNTETFTVVTSPDFPPFEFMNADGEKDGFDIDLIRALGEEMGVEFDIIGMDFGGLVAAVATGEADIAIAAMSVDEERLLSVNFTDAYFQTTQVVLVQTGSHITSLDQLHDATIAVQVGTTSAMIVEWKLPNAEAILLNQAPFTVMELMAGSVDAVVIDFTVAQLFLAEHPGQMVMLDDYLAVEEYAIAVSKEQPELLERLNEALAAIRASGEFQRIYDKWFGGE